MPTTSLDAPGPSSAAVTTTSEQQSTSTPIDDNKATHLAANSSLDISPNHNKTRPSTTPKKLTKKKSPRTVQKGKRSSIRMKATVSAARKTANTKLTKDKIATLKQNKIFNWSQSPVNISELEKKKTNRIFKDHSPGHSKPFIIAASSSAADFMVSTPSRSTVFNIAKSPPLRNIRKRHAEAIVKKTHCRTDNR